MEGFIKIKVYDFNSKLFVNKVIRIVLIVLLVVLKLFVCFLVVLVVILVGLSEPVMLFLSVFPSL